MNELFDTSIVVILAIILTMYTSYLREDLPKPMEKLFKNSIFQFFYLSLFLVFSFEALPHIAITIALIFLLTINTINYFDNSEKYQNYFNHDYNYDH